MRIFSAIHVRNGPDANGLYTISRVPIVYGDPSWVVSQVIKGGSENTLMPAPMFSVYIDNIKMAPERRQDSQFVSKVSVIERGTTGLSPNICDDLQSPTYNNQAGIRYDIDRYMPVPYDMYFKLDCWTTNTLNKFQIWEQISTIFNPSIQLQQNSNLLDWTSIFEVWMEESTWTNRSIPQGGEQQRDVMSWRFKVPIWINPPAKVKRSSIITEIITNVFDSLDVNNVAATVDNNDYDIFNTCFSAIPMQIITTEGNHKISITRNNNRDEITLLNSKTNVAQSWPSLLQLYGQIEPGITKLRLKLNPNIKLDTQDIIGSITIDSNNENIIVFAPDINTLPPNTIPPITSIIDPTEISPGHGLAVATAGQRYLLTSIDDKNSEPIIPPGVSTSPWGQNIVAYPNDIIEFNGINWIVIFDSRHSTGNNYVMNNADSTQYTYDGVNWAYTYYGKYSPGYWRIDGIINAPNGTITNNYEQ